MSEGKRHPRVLVLADVGAHSYHVGDEAVAQTAVQELTSRGWEPVVVTHGCHRAGDYLGIEVWKGLVWPNDRRVVLPAFQDVVNRVCESGQAERGTSCSVAHEEALALRQAIEGVDAVLVAGGGNFSSRFDWLLYERLATLTVAGAFGRPAVVSGQTFGPTLVPTDVEPIVKAMNACAVVGFREERSVALGRLVQGTDVVRNCLDDAQFFAIDDTERHAGVVCESPTTLRRIVATFAPAPRHVDPGAFASFIAAELDELVSRTGAEVTMVPHKASWSGSLEDEGVARMIADASQSGSIRVEPVTTARAAAELTGMADLVITSRYHPVVFSLARATPVLALAADDYGDVRMDGVAARWGLGGWTIPLTELDPGDLADAAMTVWDARRPLKQHLEALRTPMRGFHRDWWDVLDASLRGRSVAAPEVPDPAHLEAPEFLARLRRRGQRLLLVDAEAEQLRCELLDERARRSLLAAQEELRGVRLRTAITRIGGTLSSMSHSVASMWRK